MQGRLDMWSVIARRTSFHSQGLGSIGAEQFPRKCAGIRRAGPDSLTPILNRAQGGGGLHVPVRPHPPRLIGLLAISRSPVPAIPSRRHTRCGRFVQSKLCTAPIPGHTSGPELRRNAVYRDAALEFGHELSDSARLDGQRIATSFAVLRHGERTCLVPLTPQRAIHMLALLCGRYWPVRMQMRLIHAFWVGLPPLSGPYLWAEGQVRRQEAAVASGS